MKVLFDQGVPVPLRESLISLKVSTCFEMGWATLSNGQLIAEAESKFDIFVTTDKNLRYQQDLTGRKIAIFVLPTTRWPQLKPHSQKIRDAISSMTANAYIEWQLPE
jgi:hypothetical protein